jgi:hypothetical protein
MLAPRQSDDVAYAVASWVVWIEAG